MSNLIPNHWWEVKLLPEEIKWIERNGDKRNDNGKSLGWATKATSESSTDHKIGLAGELAVSLVTGIKINQITAKSKRELNTGDLGSVIEVKTRKESDESRWDIAVNEDQLKPHRAYILCLAFNFPKSVFVVGWEWGSTIENEGNKFKHRTNGHYFYVFSYKRLKKVSSLFDVLKGIE
jgi:hypothetical protein